MCIYIYIYMCKYKDLEAAGFVDIEAVDLSAPWKKWTKARGLWG